MERKKILLRFLLKKKCIYLIVPRFAKMYPITYKKKKTMNDIIVEFSFWMFKC